MQWFGDYGRFGLLALGRTALGDPLHGWRAHLAERMPATHPPPLSPSAPASGNTAPCAARLSR